MALPIARAYLTATTTGLALPVTVAAGHLVLHTSAAASPLSFKEDANLRSEVACVLDVHKIEDHLALNWILAFINSVYIASQTTLEMTKYWARGSTGVMALSRDSAFCWGHNCDELSADTIAFADSHTTSLESLFPPTRTLVSLMRCAYTLALLTSKTLTLRFLAS
jgi:hypothetical protein